MVSAATAAVSSVSDVLGSVTIPEPVKRNALKAIAQLSAAVIDIPVAYLEGVAAERRAETQARLSLIGATAQQISEAMRVDSNFVIAAADKFAKKVVRQQVNLNRISENAIAQLQTESAKSENVSGSAPVEDISEDWLNAFEIEASQKSTQEMQLLFGRILAGEISKPRSFSIKTLKLMSQLDVDVARLFQRLCSVSVSFSFGHKLYDARVISLDGNAGNNALGDYGLSFHNLNLLNEHGLVIGDYNSYMRYQGAVANGDAVNAVLGYRGSSWLLTPEPGFVENEVKLHGVALTLAGRELLSIVDVEPDEKYHDALLEYLKAKKKLRLTAVQIVQPSK